MNKLKMESLDITKANIDKIAEMFPQVVTEVADPSGAVDENGKPVLKKAIDFEKLKLVLSAGTGDYVVADDERERYEFTWVGKRQAMIDAATPIRKTLRPCPEESKDWATTENLYIEGDNLEVLKLLQESYLGKVKMIYIDPPYNTGKDFIYKDNFVQSREEYEGELDMFDEEGNRLFQNTETNGRFHSDWCSMIYPRLQLARNLLTDDGVIFISINDAEIENLKKICDEVFGEGNFIADLIWSNKEGGGSSDSKLFRIKHEHILCFARSIENVDVRGVAISNEDRYRQQDEYVAERGRYYLQKLGMGSIQYSESLDYKIITPDGGYVTPADNNNGKKACWRWSKSKFDWGVMNDFVIIQKDSSGIWTIYTKQYLNCDNEGNMIQRSQRPMGIIDEYSSTQASKLLQNLLNEKVFDYSKPYELISYLIDRIDCTNNVILDFFSGSATTAHAVMQLNAEDGGNRKFIMVQLPEVCDPNSEAAKAGYKTICEIGKERIRRAGAKITEEQKAKNNGLFAEDAKPLDTGFRVFKLDKTNMKDVYYAAGQLSQKDLWDTVSNIKDDRSDIDLLYGCLLDWGVQLTMPHTTEQIESFTVHTVDSPLTDEIDLIACFDSNVSETVVRTIAKRKPTRALFRDSSFADSANKINVFEIFKSISPDTTVKVI
ncbi:MAG: site-specific DNA-methyltransferase [Bacteroides graminisolvens]|nr:site-specific DNA-methyltransferase [Bacteroides graminisolvens]